MFNKLFILLLIICIFTFIYTKDKNVENLSTEETILKWQLQLEKLQRIKNVKIEAFINSPLHKEIRNCDKRGSAGIKKMKELLENKKKQIEAQRKRQEDLKINLISKEKHLKELIKKWNKFKEHEKEDINEVVAVIAFLKKKLLKVKNEKSQGAAKKIIDILKIMEDSIQKRLQHLEKNGKIENLKINIGNLQIKINDANTQMKNLKESLVESEKQVKSFEILSQKSIKLCEEKRKQLAKLSAEYKKEMAEFENFIDKLTKSIEELKKKLSTTVEIEKEKVVKEKNDDCGCDDCKTCDCEKDEEKEEEKEKKKEKVCKKLKRKVKKCKYWFRLRHRHHIFKKCKKLVKKYNKKCDRQIVFPKKKKLYLC